MKSAAISDVRTEADDRDCPAIKNECGEKETIVVRPTEVY